MIILVTSHSVYVVWIIIFIYNAICISSEPQKLSSDSAIKTVSTSVSVRDLDSHQNFRIAKFPKDSLVRRNRYRKIETICNTQKRSKFDIIYYCTLWQYLSALIIEHKYHEKLLYNLILAIWYFLEKLYF